MLFAGVLLAVVAFVAVIAFGGMGQQQVAPPAAEVSVVVAAVDLTVGAELTVDKLTTQNRPQADASGTYQHPEELVGRIVRRAILTGQALTADDFDTSVNQDVIQSLQSGLRAIAVPLSTVDSVGALLQAGDYVDVIISLRDTDGLNPIVVNNPNAGQTTVDGSMPDPYISLDAYLNNTSVKVVVQNVQVLAVMPRVIDQSGNAQPVTPQPDVVVVLAVTPQQSEVVRFAQLDGNISLVLRAPGDGGAADTATSGMTLKQLVDFWGVLPPKPVTP
jgi:Flp pilus assembly protein CpaB